MNLPFGEFSEPEELSVSPGLILLGAATPGTCWACESHKEDEKKSKNRNLRCTLVDMIVHWNGKANRKVFLFSYRKVTVGQVDSEFGIGLLLGLFVEGGVKV